MTRLFITCLALILTNAVIAQADFLDNGGRAPRVQTSAWTALYAGTTVLDGMSVVAVLEKSEREITIPNFMSDLPQTLVPLTSPKQSSFRLTLVAQDQSNIRVSFPIQARTVILEGQPTLTYFSEARSGDQFEFVLVPHAEGGLNVQYRRVANETGAGEFALQPLPQLF